jgi:hypothetical protein
MAMNSARRVFASLVAILLAIPLTAYAREHGSRAGAGAAGGTRRNGLAAAKNQSWHNYQGVHQAIGPGWYRQAGRRLRAGGFRSSHSYYTQNFGWPYAYNGFWTYPYAPQYTYSPHFPYLYYYDLYAQEAERSRQAADEFEALVRGERGEDGPVPIAGPEASSGSDSASPLAPRHVALTLDDQPLALTTSGGPVVISSGQHTLRIAARGVE